MRLRHEIPHSNLSREADVCISVFRDFLRPLCAYVKTDFRKTSFVIFLLCNSHFCFISQ